MSACKHMRQVPKPEPEPRTAGCEECLKIKQQWVHLRRCLICGHVGCCDQSIGKHATAHFRETGHAVIRSQETGEDWTSCYIDGGYG